MKKIKLFGLFVAAATLMFFNSCKKDDEPVKPTITVSPSATSVKAGVAVTYTVQVSSDQDLKTLAISASTKGEGASAADTTISFDKDSHSKSIDYVYTAPASATSVTITFTVTDEDESEQAVQTLTINPSITAYPTLQLGGSASLKGSYLDIDAGLVYSTSDISDATKKAAVDIIFDNASLKNTASLITTSTGTKLVKTTLTGAAFDAITTDASFGSYTATDDNITIAAGDVVFFLTASGKKGLLKVVSMTSATGDLVLSAKVSN